MNKQFSIRKFQKDYTNQLKKLISLLISQISSHLIQQSLIIIQQFLLEELANIENFSKHFLGIYTNIKLLELHKLPEMNFSDLLTDFQMQLTAIQVIPRSKRAQSTNIIQQKKSVRMAIPQSETETTMTNQIKIKTESSFLSFRDDQQQQQEILNTVQNPKMTTFNYPRQIFQDPVKRKNFVTNNQPPLYIFKSPQNLEKQQKENIKRGIPENPQIVCVYQNNQYNL